MIYGQANAFRMALEERLRAESLQTHAPLLRLRRRVVFERLLVRLTLNSPLDWIVKGGMALELRDPQRARMTRDLDVALQEAPLDGAMVRDELIDALSVDPHGDFIRFKVGRPTLLGDQSAGSQTLRFSIQAELAGRIFETVTLDVANRPDEQHDTELLDLPDTLAFAHVPTVQVATVNRARHFAEKLHAFTANYAGQINTRVKDLPDMLLLINDGLLPSHELHRVVTNVFAQRATHLMPDTLVAPSESWAPTYAAIAAELDLQEKTLNEALKALQLFWDNTRRP